VTRQMGKPIREARREVQTFFERAEHMLSIAARTLAPEVLPEKEGLHRRIEHAPLGVVLDVAAWNYPLLIPANVVVPALLAGNTVLLKHSARTPLCGDHFARAFADPELPGVMASLEIDHEQTAALIADPRAVDYVAFTGSVAGGQAVYRRAATRVLDVGLELGGKDPAYVASDADLEKTVENVVDGACYNAGQSCCAVERVYVHRRLYDEFVDRARKVLTAYRLGDPLDESTTMGPLASRPALDTLERQVDDAVRRGARLVLGGQRVPDTRGNFFPPTLLADVPNEAEVMQEESFGPLLPVRAVADDEEALRLMNDTRYGLTASVWTRDRGRADHFAGELRAGTIYQNRCDYLDPALPWTGVGDSGKGSTLSPYGFYHLTRRRSIHFRPRP
jgi:acyl-CoA reductase-like NAD-dependent aldehyde dehydrogenase